MKIKILLFILCLNLWNNVLAVSLEAKKKYPYSLLTDDYGILNEEDLHHYNRINPPKPFSDEKIAGFYWQCFPRESVRITLVDMGYSSEDWGWSEPAANLNIRVTVKPTLIHEYQMRRAKPFSDYQEHFTLWHKLMANQKHVCFIGDYIEKETKVENGLKKDFYYWTFERMKTKKGNDYLLGL